MRQVENGPVAYEEAWEEWEGEWGEVTTPNPAMSWQTPYIQPATGWSGPRMAPDPTWNYGPQGSWGESPFPLQPAGGLVYPQAVYQVAVEGGKGAHKGGDKGGGKAQGKGNKGGKCGRGMVALDPVQPSATS